MSCDLAVQTFLIRLRSLLKRKGAIEFRKTRKNREALLELGLNVEDVLDIVARLESSHYHAGPEADRDGSAGNVMVFFYPYEGCRLYIKLKIWAQGGKDQGVIMSFHEEGMHDE